MITNNLGQTILLNIWNADNMQLIHPLVKYWNFQLLMATDLVL